MQVIQSPRPPCREHITPQHCLVDNMARSAVLLYINCVH